jgi:1-aminocyclopropane-1-carboxylate deaminase/D-cysteine desulfhydrase-like pyridoxal-dependent ACC family enzyme
LPGITPLKSYAGVEVKREDLNPAGPSGKLRGLLPYLTALRESGVRHVVNAGATHSNSHAIVAWAARALGLKATTFVNSSREHAAPAYAARLGASVRYLRPMHLGPLKALARVWAEAEGAYMLPWGLSCPEIVRGYAPAVAEVPAEPGTVHVIPLGAGGWAAGVWYGLRAAGREEEVTAVSVMPTDRDAEKVCRLLGGLCPRQGTLSGPPDAEPWPELPGNLRIVPTEGPAPTPWASDPRYEHAAWPEAIRSAAEGRRTVFWSIGSHLEAWPPE